ncbi:MAG TPA: septum formation initiator family protein [Candidatus Limnocylindrales bacterium]|nr:septum formation initiator family protein [Candidatus Limnocylindrales bacterium]
MINLESLKNRDFGLLVDELRDVRTLGLIAFGIIVLLVSWSGVKAIQTNYQLQKQISQLQQENEVQKLKNSNQQLKNEYYKSSQYLELSARQNFGLAAPGEKILIVPKEVALAHVSGVKAVDVISAVEKRADNHPFYQKNWQAWLDFFLHRSPAATVR